MKVDWTNAQHVDGPGFVRWCEGIGVIPPEGHIHARLGETTARAVRAWREGRRVTIWAADELLTRYGYHLREIPENLLLFEPAVAALTGLLEQRPINAIAREAGCDPVTIRYWRKQHVRSGVLEVA